MADYFFRQHHPAQFPQIISNACISGLCGLIQAQRLVTSGRYDRVIVIAADAASDFVLEGFGYLQAVSQEPCKPFDINRKGISLGEGAALCVIEKAPSSAALGKIYPGAVTNDANHISGPSRDGSGLYKAVKKALDAAGTNLSATDHFISCHGTGTLYNDEMEAKAFYPIAGEDIFIHGMKGYFGHTLGASGLMEFVINLITLQSGVLPSTHGYSEHGVSLPVKIAAENTEGKWKGFLKTGSGFGGCNAALFINSMAA